MPKQEKKAILRFQKTIRRQTIRQLKRLRRIHRRLVQKPKLKLRRLYIKIGIALIAAAVVVFGATFWPVAFSEIRFQIEKNRQKKVVAKSAQIPGQKEKNIDYLIPADTNFGIVIPKIEANAKIIPNVDPNNEPVYQRALTQGVAQAAGSATPDQFGNIFIFAHSGQDIFEANRYNAVFYLLSKLETGDEIDIFYQQKKYIYQVTGKNIVSPEETSSLDDPDPTQKTLTLMTCWPGGTTWKRLLVEAKQQ